MMESISMKLELHGGDDLFEKLGSENKRLLRTFLGTYLSIKHVSVTLLSCYVEESNMKDNKNKRVFVLFQASASLD